MRHAIEDNRVAGVVHGVRADLHDVTGVAARELRMRRRHGGDGEGADFRRHAAHYSGQYFGASISALTQLANRKGYALIGGNSAGNNAYFVREDLLGDELQAVSPQKAFVSPQFRESRDRTRRLDYLDFERRQALIRGLPVVNTTNGSPEAF